MLSWMATDFFRNSPVLIAPVIALLLLLAVFVTVTFRALLTNKEEIEHMTQLPLENDDE